MQWRRCSAPQQQPGKCYNSERILDPLLELAKLMRALAHHDLVVTLHQVPAFAEGLEAGGSTLIIQLPVPVAALKSKLLSVATHHAGPRLAQPTSRSYQLLGPKCLSLLK